MEGHARIYQFVKRLYAQIESLKVINSVPSASQATQAQASERRTQAGAKPASSSGQNAPFGSEGGTGGIRQRSSDPTSFDTEQYMADLEANLLEALNIPTGETPTLVYGSNHSNSRTGTGRG